MGGRQAAQGVCSTVAQRCSVALCCEGAERVLRSAVRGCRHGGKSAAGQRWKGQLQRWAAGRAAMAAASWHAFCSTVWQAVGAALVLCSAASFAF